MSHSHAHSSGQNSHLAAHQPHEDAICLDHVSFRYPRSPRSNRTRQQGQPAAAPVLTLRDVTLHINRGVSLGIIGPNGAGKTTLIKIILGLLDGYTGDVRVMGLNPRDACRRGDIIGYVPQRHEVEWRFPVTARHVVAMGLVGKTGLFRRIPREDHDYALEMMRRVRVDHLADCPIGDLSGGQQQRLFIARALAPRPKILILDEPLVGVDEAGQQQFAKLIHELHESLELTVVIVSHDLQAIAAGCNQVACLRQSIHFHDAPDGLTQDVLAEVFTHEITPVLKGLAEG